MSAQSSELSPRISDLYGEARLDVLYRRAAADRDRFARQQASALQPGPIGRLIAKLRDL